jgi:hypothetical protein
MQYRIILTANGLYKKTLFKSKSIEGAYFKFHDLKENNKVHFPRKFINSNGIKPVKYNICVTKITEENDKFRILRDDYGKLYTEKPIGKWTILASESFDIEEKFWIFDMDNVVNRPTILDVIKKLVIGAHSKKMVKQIIVVHNKLIIHNEDQFDMVICKNILDAQRLHHTLAKISNKQKLKSLIFLGTATPATVSRMYKIIHEETGWPYTKIRRRTTRP